MAVSVDSVRELRGLSGAGVMDCKKALIETNGDVQEALDWLRKKGLGQALKKVGRTAAEGLVVVACAGQEGVLVEINAETDFVARNEKFISFASSVASLALASPAIRTVEELSSATLDNGQSVHESLIALIGLIGENMTLRRLSRLTVENGFVAGYIHAKVSDNAGRIGVLVGLIPSGHDRPSQEDDLTQFARQLAMHVAATRPQALDSSDLPESVIERERAVLVEQAQESGKPQTVIEKMVEGRLRKFLKEVTLLEQPFVVNPDQTVREALEQKGKILGCSLTLKAFQLFEVGEGIEKTQSNFAQEVAEAAQH